MTGLDRERVRRGHELRVTAARKRLEAGNTKLARGRARGLEKAFRQAAERFLGEGQSPPPMKLDQRWPFTYGRPGGSVPLGVREEILRRDRVCRWCRRRPATTIDHVHPLSRGGGSHPLNLVGSCLECNNAKANFLPEEIGWTPRLTLGAFDIE